MSTLTVGVISKEREDAFKPYLTVEDLGEGYYKVSKKISDVVLYNIINRNGLILCENWYEQIGEFNYGKAITFENGRFNLITKYGKRLLRKLNSFTDIKYTTSGIYIVKDKKEKYNLLGKENHLLNHTWFDKITNVTKHGAVVIHESTVYKDEEGNPKKQYNYLNTEGRLIFIRSCPKIEEYDEYIRAYFNDSADRSYNGDVLWQRIIKKSNGKVMAEGRFIGIYEIQGGYKVIQREGEEQYNLLTPSYKLVFDRWYHDVSVFFYGVKGNNNIFFAAGNKVGNEVKFRIFNKERKDIFGLTFETLYPLNSQKGEYLLIRGKEKYKADIQNESLIKLQ